MGYGDIVIVNIGERILCIILQFLGVIFFSFAAGSLTNIIANIDTNLANKQDKINILNKMLKEYHLPTEIYIQLLINSSAFDDQKTMDETKKFLD